MERRELIAPFLFFGGGMRKGRKEGRRASEGGRLLARRMRALPEARDGDFHWGLGRKLILACDLQGRKVEWAYGLGLACRNKQHDFL